VPHVYRSGAGLEGLCAGRPSIERDEIRLVIRDKYGFFFDDDLVQVLVGDAE
jgi:hypothetical protein